MLVYISNILAGKVILPEIQEKLDFAGRIKCNFFNKPHPIPQLIVSLRILE